MMVFQTPMASLVKGFLVFLRAYSVFIFWRGWEGVERVASTVLGRAYGKFENIVHGDYFSFV